MHAFDKSIFRRWLSNVILSTWGMGARCARADLYVEVYMETKQQDLKKKQFWQRIIREAI
jgi:hypothetical protein